jgi:hypothetical protein
MALTHRTSTTVRSNAGSVTAYTGTYTGTHEYNLEKTFAIGTDVAQDMAADVSTIVSLAIMSTTALTIETNSSSAPDDTIVLVANKPVIWNTDMLATLGVACPLTVDITTGLFITNAAAADLTIYILFSGS